MDELSAKNRFCHNPFIQVYIHVCSQKYGYIYAKFNGATIPIVPKKITIGIWVSIAKEPFMESAKSNWFMKL